MPLWKIHHPVDAYTPADKKEFAGAITAVYDAVPIPRFYVVVLFEEVPADSFYVGGDPTAISSGSRSTRWRGPCPVRSSGNGGSGTSTRSSPPRVKDRGYDWEFTITEPPFDLWSLQGEIPPPFESMAEKRWIKENKASPYAHAEKLPVNLALAPGTTGE